MVHIWRESGGGDGAEGVSIIFVFLVKVCCYFSVERGRVCVCVCVGGGAGGGGGSNYLFLGWRQMGMITKYTFHLHLFFLFVRQNTLVSKYLNPLSVTLHNVSWLRNLIFINFHAFRFLKLTNHAFICQTLFKYPRLKILMEKIVHQHLSFLL